MLLFFFRTKLETIPTTQASVKQPPNLTVVRCSLHGHGAFSENATQVTKQTPQRVEIQVNDNLSIVCIIKQVSYVSIRAAQKFWGLNSQTPKWTTVFQPVARSYLYLTFQNIFISVNLYMSPVETWCRNIDYFIPDEEGKTKDFKTEVMTKIRKFNSYIFIHINHIICSSHAWYYFISSKRPLFLLYFSFQQTEIAHCKRILINSC